VRQRDALVRAVSLHRAPPPAPPREEAGRGAKSAQPVRYDSLPVYGGHRAAEGRGGARPKGASDGTTRKSSANRKTRHPTSGLTLVETLVALTIVAAIASLSVLTLSRSGGSADPRSEALRLATRLESAVDAALTASRRFVFEARPEGYAIHAATRPGDDAAPFAARTFPGTIRMATEGSDTIAIGGTFAQPFTALLRGGGEAWTIRFDGLDARISEGTGGETNARN